MTRRLLAAAAAVILAAPAAAAPKELPDKRPQVEVVFCLDTTGSMGGLIEGAKQKIWSISNQIVAGKPTPSLKVGLYGYRDRKDAYVTKMEPLTDDLDKIYSTLKEFKAEGGGDTPESVTRLFTSRSPSSSGRTTRDAQDRVPRRRCPAAHGLHRRRQFPDTCKLATEKGILITRPVRGRADTAKVWQEISEGERVVRPDRPGRAQVGRHPFDKRLGEINAELENSTLVREPGEAGARPAIQARPWTGPRRKRPRTPRVTRNDVSGDGEGPEAKAGTVLPAAPAPGAGFGAGGGALGVSSRPTAGPQRHAGHHQQLRPD